ncbi:CRISPR-associated protein, Cas2 family [Thermosyntropha lipolytica DSM 11003]|uniref:CRISPR-associated endoribonuclease Cas2 n=1 Tax=Thermosyntropha lipolytica DSM 11003 TaxID=1123382 RepID=A0A1M5Q3N5_9FIRM|nr:CRISPR-associated endonuclease Cas2 [Thermosyntropha lipolytica]SHH08602.1 CRISPR-associated protein, Cas2 family [Thermosyntropha lipolytica DSM 11003]
MINIRVILIYDISTDDEKGKRRLVKIMKTCRKYLVHVQKSVFEGDITEGQMLLLKKEILAVINKQQDFVIIYSLPDGNKLSRDILTDTRDPMDNFL